MRKSFFDLEWYKTLINVIVTNRNKSSGLYDLTYDGSKVNITIPNTLDEIIKCEIFNVFKYIFNHIEWKYGMYVELFKVEALDIKLFIHLEYIDIAKTKTCF